jgi:DNA-directed RNA polymerase specialized sigma24 family protein
VDYNPLVPKTDLHKVSRSTLTPQEPQLHGSGDEEKEPAPSSPSEGKWMATEQSFNLLLAAFSPDRNEAANQYEIARRKLIRFFEHRHFAASERLADETLDRVMRRIEEGKNIANLMAYIYRVAAYVAMEAFKEEERMRSAVKTMPTVAPPRVTNDDEEGLRLRCFDTCLDDLPAETRTLILSYYGEQGGAKIQLRQQMALGLGIRLNALRIRAHKIRVILEECVRQCISRNETKQPSLN